MNSNNVDFDYELLNPICYTSLIFSDFLTPFDKFLYT